MHEPQYTQANEGLTVRRLWAVRQLLQSSLCRLLFLQRKCATQEKFNIAANAWPIKITPKFYQHQVYICSALIKFIGQLNRYW